MAFYFYYFSSSTIIVLSIIVVALYIYTAIMHMKALKKLHYSYAWLAWIPYGCWYACADAVTEDNAENIMLFGKIEVPMLVFKLWWIIAAISNMVFIPFCLLIVMVIRTVFLGYAYTKMFSMLERMPERSTAVDGCVAGFFPVIAAYRFSKLKS